MRGDPTARIDDAAARTRIGSYLAAVRREASVVIALAAVAAAWFLLPRLLHRSAPSASFIDSTQVEQFAAANTPGKTPRSDTAREETLQLHAWVTPSDRVVVVRVDLDRDDDVEVVVCSLDEQRVRTLWRGMLQAGETVLTWDRRTADGREVPAGDYVVMASASGHRANARFVVPSAR